MSLAPAGGGAGGADGTKENAGEAEARSAIVSSASAGVTSNGEDKNEAVAFARGPWPRMPLRRTAPNICIFRTTFERLAECGIQWMHLTLSQTTPSASAWRTPPAGTTRG